MTARAVSLAPCGPPRTAKPVECGRTRTAPVRPRALVRRPASLLVALLFLGGCALPSAEEWVAEAAAAHRAADEALARGDGAAARAALAAFVDAPRSPSVSPHDRRVLVQDACFRISVIELDGAAPDAALRWAERGLLAGVANDVFTANLFLAKARALEGLGREREAAVEYLRALDVNERLLERALGSGTGGTR